MLRLALILALLAAVGGIVVSQFVTKPRVDQLSSDLAMTQDTLSRTQSDLATSRQKEREVTDALEIANRDLTETRANLETTSRDLLTQRNRADRLDTDLNRITQERNIAQAELAKWEALGVRPEQITEIRRNLRNMTDERNVLLDEKEILHRQIAQLDARILKYEDPSAKVALPQGLKGQVIAVSPQQDFVLINIGEGQGVLERGELIVRRGTQLVGKVRVVSVDPSRSVANVLPDWSLEGVAISEGDTVLY
jgi:hypothetical protein